MVGETKRLFNRRIGGGELQIVPIYYTNFIETKKNYFHYHILISSYRDRVKPFGDNYKFLYLWNFIYMKKE